MASDPINLDNLTDVLAQAFIEDPLFVYCFPDADKRLALSSPTHRLLARQALAHGRLDPLHVDGKLCGAALWLPSASRHLGLWELLRLGGLQAVVKQGVVASWRQIRLGELYEKRQRELLPEPHWYLLLLGILKAQRGKGLSRKLLAPMLEKSDREGFACYLDTHELDNVSIYRRFGFEVVDEMVAPGTDLRHWSMIRRPH